MPFSDGSDKSDRSDESDGVIDRWLERVAGVSSHSLSLSLWWRSCFRREWRVMWGWRWMARGAVKRPRSRAVRWTAPAICGRTKPMMRVAMRVRRKRCLFLLLVKRSRPNRWA